MISENGLPTFKRGNTAQQHQTCQKIEHRKNNNLYINGQGTLYNIIIMIFDDKNQAIMYESSIVKINRSQKTSKLGRNHRRILTNLNNYLIDCTGSAGITTSTSRSLLTGSDQSGPGRRCHHRADRAVHCPSGRATVPATNNANDR